MTIRRPRKQGERIEETRAKIEKAALQLFMRNGFEATSVVQIVKRAGFTRGAFYCNYEDKEELIIAVMERVLGGWTRNFADLKSAHDNPRDLLISLQKFYARQVVSGSFALPAILFEYKLYAIRHRGRHSRLAKAYARVRADREHILKETMEALALQSGVGPDMLEGALAALVVGLSLDRAFYQGDYQPTGKELESTINLVFERIIAPNVLREAGESHWTTPV